MQQSTGRSLIEVLMKSLTRRGILVLLLVLSVGVVSWAQPAEAPPAKYNFPTLMKNFKVSLRSDVPGVLESTMYNLIQCKNIYPDQEYTKVYRILDEVAMNAADATIAYKASLVRLYLAYGTTFTDPTVFDYSDHEKAFKQVANQLASSLLVSR
jgi:hypothetical protein